MRRLSMTIVWPAGIVIHIPAQGARVGYTTDQEL